MGPAADRSDLVLLHFEVVKGDTRVTRPRSRRSLWMVSERRACSAQTCWAGMTLTDGHPHVHATILGVAPTCTAVVRVRRCRRARGRVPGGRDPWCGRKGRQRGASPVLTSAG